MSAELTASEAPDTPLEPTTPLEALSAIDSPAAELSDVSRLDELRRGSTVPPSPAFTAVTDDDADLPDALDDGLPERKRIASVLTDDREETTGSGVSRVVRRRKPGGAPTRKSARAEGQAEGRARAEAKTRLDRAGDKFGDSGRFSLDKLMKEKIARQKRAAKDEEEADKMAEIMADEVRSIHALSRILPLKYAQPAVNGIVSPRGLEKLAFNVTKVSPSKRTYRKHSEMDAALEAVSQGSMLAGNVEERKLAVGLVKDDFMHNESDKERDVRIREHRLRQFWGPRGYEAESYVALPTPPALPENAGPFLSTLHDSCSALADTQSTPHVNGRLKDESSDTEISDEDKEVSDEPTEEPWLFPQSLVPDRIGTVSMAEAHIAISWLFNLVTHPGLPETAEDAVAPVLRLLEHAAGPLADRQNRSASLPLTLDIVYKAFQRLGCQVPKPTDEDDRASSPLPGGAGFAVMVSTQPTGKKKVSFGHAERETCTMRMLRIIERLAKINAWQDATSDLVGIATLLLRLFLDPEGQSLAEDVKDALHSVCRALFALGLTSTHALFCAFAGTFGIDAGDIPMRIQMAVVQVLPHRTWRESLLRRWLAFSFLTRRRASSISESDLSAPFDYFDVLNILQGDTIVSPFCWQRGKMNDARVFYGACLMSIALSHLRADFTAKDEADAVLRESKKRLASKQIKSIVEALSRLEPHITFDIRKDTTERSRAKSMISLLRQNLQIQLPSSEVASTIQDFFSTRATDT